ncbi:MAG: DUF6519 domain-containing protein [Sneathiella sp.]
MRGNFSRTRFPPSQRGALWMQQGRPLLDSDWNVQLTLAEAAVRERIESLVGPSGAPADNAGFNIKPIPGFFVNRANISESVQGISLDTNPDFPFPYESHSARPFFLQIGFMIESKVAGMICHVPGLFRLALTDRQTLSLSVRVKSDAGLPQEISAEGKFEIPVNHLQRIDVSFDGLCLNVYIPAETGEKTEISLNISDLEPETVNRALLLGRPQDGFPAHENSSRKSFDKPLEAAFWQLTIVDIFYEISLTSALGERLELEENILCHLDFSTLENSYIPDLSGNNNAGWVDAPEAYSHLGLLDAVISSGLYLTEGRLVKNKASCLFSNQPHRATQALQRQIGPFGEPAFYRFYLDSWHRLVTDIEAPENHDPALGNIDTTADLRTIWQVKCLTDTNLDALEQKWNILTEPSEEGRIRLRRKASYQALPNGLLRVEIHQSGWTHHWPPSEKMRAAAIPVRLYENQQQRLVVEAPYDREDWVQLDRPLLVFAGTGDPDCPEPTGSHAFVSIVDLQQADGYTILGLNHPTPNPVQGEDFYILPLATYKYSTNNGCLAYPVSNIIWLEGQNQISAELAFPGYNGMEIKNGVWLELGNLELQEAEQPGLIFQVENFIPDRLQLILSPQMGRVGASNTELPVGTSPTLTLWEGQFTLHGTPAAQGKWHLLADGIELEFEPGKYYKSGQYWSSAMREALPAGLDWPSLSDGNPAFLEPEGPLHTYVALNDLTLEDGGYTSKDLRNIYRALVNEPFSDIDKETVEILKKTAKLMMLLGIEDWQIDRQNLPYILEELTRFILEDIYGGSLRLLGIDSDIRGLSPTGETVKLSGTPFLEWQETDKFSASPEGEIISATLAGQNILVSRTDNSIRCWSNAEQSWKILSHIPDERTDYSIAWDETHLFVVGGHVPSLFSCWRSRRILSLDSAGNWQVAGAIPHRNRFPITACNGGFLYVASGYDHRFDPFGKAGYLDLRTGSWHSLGECEHLPHKGAASLFIDNQWMIFGGELRAEDPEGLLISDKVYAYDPLSRAWTEKQSLPIPLTGHRLFPNVNGLYILGGKTTYETSSSTCFLYTIENDSWQETGDLSIGRSYFGLLPTEEEGMARLYAIGGFLRDDLPAFEADGCSLHKNLFVYY